MDDLKATSGQRIELQNQGPDLEDFQQQAVAMQSRGLAGKSKREKTILEDLVESFLYKYQSNEDDITDKYKFNDKDMG